MQLLTFDLRRMSENQFIHFCSYIKRNFSHFQRALRSENGLPSFPIYMKRNFSVWDVTWHDNHVVQFPNNYKSATIFIYDNMTSGQRTSHILVRLTRYHQRTREYKKVRREAHSKSGKGLLVLVGRKASSHRWQIPPCIGSCEIMKDEEEW